MKGDEEWRRLFAAGGRAAENAALALIERIKALEAERHELRAVLDDVLHERGQSWLAELEKRRSSVYHLLRHHETNYEYDTALNACKTCEAMHDTHLAGCDYAELLRLIGGPEETQRQVDAAHEEAMNTIVVTAVDPVQRSVTFGRIANELPQITADPNVRDGQVLAFSEETWPPPRNWRDKK